MKFRVLALVGVVMAGMAVPAAQQAPPQNEPRPVFRASVARVSLAATVRDKRGKPVTTLNLEDFHLLDNGQPAKILEFSRAEAGAREITFNAVAGSYTLSGMRHLDHASAPYTVTLSDSPYNATLDYADFGGAPQAVFEFLVHGNSSAVTSCAPIIFPRIAVSDRLMWLLTVFTGMSSVAAISATSRSSW